MKTPKQLQILLAISGLIISACAHSELPKESDIHTPKPAIESLKNYHESTKAVMLEQSKKKIAPPEFVCKSNSNHPCSFQKSTHDSLHYDPDSRFFVDGKYRVMIAYPNLYNVPDMDRGAETFTGMTLGQTQDLTPAIFEKYFGPEYQTLNPELYGAVSRGLLLVIYIDDPELLNQFSDDERIIGMYHAGNNMDVYEGHSQ